ncbi:NUDIX domain-containing protein [Patescibacteria group bacterium]|nr:NUDIX domain-containing protein [Patescibacteria group bacterium]
MEIKNDTGEIIKAGCVVVDGSKVLLVTDRDRKVWAFPKGHAENSETVEQIALRETLEETGYKVEIVKRLQDVVYRYESNGAPVRVAMFLAKPIEKVDEGEGNAEWVDATKARDLIWTNGIPLLDEIGI